MSFSLIFFMQSIKKNYPNILFLFTILGAADRKPLFALNHLLFAALTLSAAAFGLTNSRPWTGVKTKEDDRPFVWPELALIYKKNEINMI